MRRASNTQTFSGNGSVCVDDYTKSYQVESAVFLQLCMHVQSLVFVSFLTFSVHWENRISRSAAFMLNRHDFCARKLSRFWRGTSYS